MDNILKRAFHYRYADGLAEITVGGACMLAAALLMLGYWVFDRPNDLPWTVPALAAVAIIGALGLGIWGLGRGMDTLKERVVYPRTGYVSYRRDESEQQRIVQTVFWGSLALGLLLSRSESLFIFVSMGPALGYILFYYGRKTGIRRFYVEAALAVTLVLAVPLTRTITSVDDLPLNALYLAALGIVLSLAGGLAFWHYVRRAPAAEAQP